MRPAGHSHFHGNRTCYLCGVILSDQNTCPTVVVRGSGRCRKCQRNSSRDLYGHEPLNVQTPGAMHTFPCGCSGVLPEQRGQSNQLARWVSKTWGCRVQTILAQNNILAQQHGYTPIDPHSVIRKLMEEPNCVCCGEPLAWEFGYGKTPHLDHDHETGEIRGFAHARCNPRALELTNERLRGENTRLRRQLEGLYKLHAA
jgi:hypothetical protein